MIKKITAKEIFDSRGNPTIETEIVLEDGSIGIASVPSGASTGSHEAVELRDKDITRYDGRGVLKAIENVNTFIAKEITGKDWQQEELDDFLKKLDGTENKSQLGANAILSVSLSFAKAVAKSKKIELFEHIRNLSKNPKDICIPLPLCNILNGGVHTGWKSTEIQEFMVAPISAKNFRESFEMLKKIFETLGQTIKEKGYEINLGDEGGYAPELKNGNEEALDLISEAVIKSGFKLKEDIVFALDVAASELKNKEKYNIEFYINLIEKFPIFSIEDPFDENDWENWKNMTSKISDLQIVGDDLLTTNVKFLKKAIEEKAGNAILIKPNQVGTLSETIEAVDTAHRAGWKTIISHRSGETSDTTIAHIAVGLGSGQIKTGSVSQRERLVKYEELIKIEEKLG